MSAELPQHLSAHQTFVDTLGEQIAGLLAKARALSGKPVSQLRIEQLDDDRWVIELTMADPDEEYGPAITVLDGFGSSPSGAIADLRMVRSPA